MMTSYTAVLFDAGGTLWYARKTVVEVWHEVLAAQGMEISISYTCVGLPNRFTREIRLRTYSRVNRHS